MSITTGKVRASFVNVFTPQAPIGGGEAKYSITLLIPKTDVTTLNAIQAEIERAKQEGVSRVFGGTMPAMVKSPLYDGDGVRVNGEPFGEECRRCMVLRASSKDQPSVVDLSVQPILNVHDVYSGCFVRASINFFAYNQNGNRGIGCGLNAVQKIEDGEPLTSRVSAQEAFGGNNAYAGGFNAAPYAPQQNPVSGQAYQAQTPYMQQPYSAVPPQQNPVPGQMYDPVTGAPIGGGVMGI